MGDVPAFEGGKEVRVGILETGYHDGGNDEDIAVVLRRQHLV